MILVMMNARPQLHDRTGRLEMWHSLRKLGLYLHDRTGRLEKNPIYSLKEHLLHDRTGRLEI